MVRGTLPLTLNHRALAEAQHPLGVQQEREALLRNLRRVVWVLTFGTEPENDYTLAYGAPTGGVLPADTGAAAWIADGLVMFQTRDGVVSRHSRLV